jgi:hypothetical protein
MYILHFYISIFFLSCCWCRVRKRTSTTCGCSWSHACPTFRSRTPSARVPSATAVRSACHPPHTHTHTHTRTRTHTHHRTRARARTHARAPPRRALLDELHGLPHITRAGRCKHVAAVLLTWADSPAAAQQVLYALLPHPCLAWGRRLIAVIAGARHNTHRRLSPADRAGHPIPCRLRRPPSPCTTRWAPPLRTRSAHTTRHTSGWFLQPKPDIPVCCACAACACVCAVCCIVAQDVVWQFAGTTG